MKSSSSFPPYVFLYTVPLYRTGPGARLFLSSPLLIELRKGSKIILKASILADKIAQIGN